MVIDLTDKFSAKQNANKAGRAKFAADSKEAVMVALAMTCAKAPADIATILTALISYTGITTGKMVALSLPEERRAKEAVEGAARAILSVAECVNVGSLPDEQQVSKSECRAFLRAALARASEIVEGDLFVKDDDDAN